MSYWQYGSNGSDNGLLPIRQQAIIWTNVGMLYWCICVTRPQWVNRLRQRQNGCHFAGNVFKCIFFKENVQMSFKISLTFVPKHPIENNPALVQVINWRPTGQTIIWTNDDPVWGSIYASLSLNELNVQMMTYFQNLTLSNKLQFESWYKMLFQVNAFQ